MDRFADDSRWWTYDHCGSVWAGREFGGLQELPRLKRRVDHAVTRLELQVLPTGTGYDMAASSSCYYLWLDTPCWNVRVPLLVQRRQMSPHRAVAVAW